MASIKIPEPLKQDVPQNKWGKILLASPVVMTVIATLLAGLASSEMTKAQYDRSLAAQQQSKAGDQWSFFQAKRQRGAIQESTFDILGASRGQRPVDPSRLQKQLAALSSSERCDSLRKGLQSIIGSPAGQAALRHLSESTLPSFSTNYEPDPRVLAALKAIDEGRPDAEIAALMGQIDSPLLERSLRSAREQTRLFDEAAQPVTKAIERMEGMLRQLRSEGLDESIVWDFSAARIHYNSQRYDAEARINQQIASVLELQVHKNNISAERHHRRSQRFFYGMLAAQLGVIVSTFAIAAQKRNFLWSFAAAAGLIALSVGAWVYLFV
jgi:hypothetical protein